MRKALAAIIKVIAKSLAIFFSILFVLITILILPLYVAAFYGPASNWFFRRPFVALGNRLLQSSPAGQDYRFSHIHSRPPVVILVMLVTDLIRNCCSTPRGWGRTGFRWPSS